MANTLLVQADMIRDGVLIALKAQSREEYIKALEATLRVSIRLQEALKAESRRRYSLRYTQDLRVIDQGDDLEPLCRVGDYKVHVVDNETGDVVWQCSQSVRFGRQGLKEGAA